MLNRIIIMGRLTHDPENKKTPAGTSVCKFSVAVNRSHKDKDGKKVEETDYFDCDAWASTADTVGRYFRKGSMILVEGEMRNNNWTDNNGTKHYGMRLNVSSISFCGDSQGSGQQNSQPPQGYQPQPQQYQQSGQYQQAPPQQYGQPPQGYQQPGQYQQPQQYQQPPQDYPPIW